MHELIYFIICGAYKNYGKETKVAEFNSLISSLGR